MLIFLIQLILMSKYYFRERTIFLSVTFIVTLMFIFIFKIFPFVELFHLSKFIRANWLHFARDNPISCTLVIFEKRFMQKHAEGIFLHVSFI